MTSPDLLTRSTSRPALVDGWLRAGIGAALVAAAGFLLVSFDSLLRGGAETARDAVLVPAWLGAMVALAAVHRTGDRPVGCAGSASGWSW